MTLLRCPRFLPNPWIEVREQDRYKGVACAGFLYIVIFTTVFRGLRDIAQPATTSHEQLIKNRDYMPLLTLCMDRGYGSLSNISLLGAMTISGFGAGHGINRAFNTFEDFAENANDEDDYVVLQNAKDEEHGDACVLLNLTQFQPEFDNKTQINNIGIGGIFLTPPNGVKPRFISVSASKDSTEARSSTNTAELAAEIFGNHQSPMIFLDTEDHDIATFSAQQLMNAALSGTVFDLLEGPNGRMRSPTFSLSVQNLPNYSVYDYYANRDAWKDWRFWKHQLPSWARDVSGDTVTRYEATRTGAWFATIPPHLAKNQAVQDSLMTVLQPHFLDGNGPNVSFFGFGLFVLNPTETVLSYQKESWRLQALFSLFGGLLYLSYSIFDCCFTKPRAERVDTVDSRRYWRYSRNSVPEGEMQMPLL